MLFWGKNKAEPLPLEEVRPEYHQFMQASLSAYFNVHGINPDKPIPAGLTVPWVVAGSSANSERYNHTRGYLVATGEYSPQKNWPVFIAVTHRDSTYPCFSEIKLAMKP